MTREVLDAITRSLTQRLDRLENSQAVSQGANEEGQRTTHTVVAIAAFTITAVLSLVVIAVNLLVHKP